MTPSTPLRLTLIGRFALWRGSQELGIAASGQRLIALLALRIARSAGFMWPGRSGPTIRLNAHWPTCVPRCGGLTSPGAGDRCHPVAPEARRRLEVDVAIWSRSRAGLTRRGPRPNVDLDSVRLADLVGDLLPDWYDDWLQDEREGLRQIRLHALESLARRLSAVRPLCRRHPGRTRRNPPGTIARDRPSHSYRDPPGRGQRSEAWRQFQRCRRLLREELGVEPSDSMRLLLERTALPLQLHGFSLCAVTPQQGDFGCGAARGP